MDLEVQTPREKSDHAFWGTVVELWIQKGDCELEAKGRCEREGIGHCVWGDDRRIPKYLRELRLDARIGDYPTQPLVVCLLKKKMG